MSVNRIEVNGISSKVNLDSKFKCHAKNIRQQQTEYKFIPKELLFFSFNHDEKNMQTGSNCKFRNASFIAYPIYCQFQQDFLIHTIYFTDIKCTKHLKATKLKKNKNKQNTASFIATIFTLHI